MQNYGAGDLLEIRMVATGKSELLPFTEAVVPEIDLAARRMVVIPPALTEGGPAPRQKKDETWSSPHAQKRDSPRSFDQPWWASVQACAACALCQPRM